MNLNDVVHQYMKARKLVVPDANDAFLFLTSEIGELSDAMVHTRAAWVRNDPSKNRNVADEIGDVIMMLTCVADALGLDPVQCMLDKMKKKGFEPVTPNE